MWLVYIITFFSDTKYYSQCKKLHAKIIFLLFNTEFHVICDTSWPLNLKLQYFSVKLSDNMKASSFKKLQKVRYISLLHVAVCYTCLNTFFFLSMIPNLASVWLSENEELFEWQCIHASRAFWNRNYRNTSLNSPVNQSSVNQTRIHISLLAFFVFFAGAQCGLSAQPMCTSVFATVAS